MTDVGAAIDEAMRVQREIDECRHPRYGSRRHNALDPTMRLSWWSCLKDGLIRDLHVTDVEAERAYTAMQEAGWELARQGWTVKNCYDDSPSEMFWDNVVA